MSTDNADDWNWRAAMRPSIENGAPFEGHEREDVIDQIVLHEPAARTIEETLQALRGRDLSVHYTVDQQGTIRRHLAPERKAWHAGPKHNDRSIAIEVVGVVYGEWADEDKQDQVIDTCWVHDGPNDRRDYVVPPAEQLEATWQLVRHLCWLYDIPLRFPAVSRTGFRWGRVDGLGPGILAHHRTAHSDGLVPEHDCLYRSLGASPKRAYELTVEAAASGNRETTVHREELA